VIDERIDEYLTRMEFADSEEKKEKNLRLSHIFRDNLKPKE